MEHFGEIQKNGLIYKTQSYTIGVHGKFDKIAFRIQGSHIEVEGQAFPLGELTADILNITPEELAFTFQMIENAVLKAKEKALVRLPDVCLNGELGVWREVRNMMRAALRGQKAP